MGFQDQRPCVVYRGCMLRQGNGVPFFLPEPASSSPLSFSRNGLSIGDVVILTEEGSYNFLFNVHARADHELNAGNVPTDFEPLRIPCGPVVHDYYYNVGATVAANDEYTTSFNMEASADTPLVVGAGGSASIELSTSRVKEAFLMLPDGATRRDAMNEKLYERYAEKHAESWRKYIDDLGHHLPNGSLYLVTGCDKAPTWGLAVARKPSSSFGVSLKFSAFSVGAGFTYRTSWSGSTGTTTRSYPPQGVDLQLAQNSPPKKNQCLFARGLTISFRKSRMAIKLSGTVRTDWIKGSPLDRYPSFLRSSSPRSPFGGHSLSRRSSPPSSNSSSPSSSKSNSPPSYIASLSPDDLFPELVFQTADEFSDEDEVESCLLESQFVSPATRLSNGILDTNPEAHMAIVSDRMWMAHITSIPDGPRLVRKIMSEHETIIHNGVAILQDAFVSGGPETVEKPQIGPLVGDVEGGNAGFRTNFPLLSAIQVRRDDSPAALMHREFTPPVASPSATTIHDSDDKNGWLKHAEESFDKSYKCLWRNGTGMTSQCLYRGNRQLMKWHVETVHMKLPVRKNLHCQITS